MLLAPTITLPSQIERRAARAAGLPYVSPGILRPLISLRRYMGAHKSQKRRTERRVRYCHRLAKVSQDLGLCAAAIDCRIVDVVSKGIYTDFDAQNYYLERLSGARKFRISASGESEALRQADQIVAEWRATNTYLGGAQLVSGLHMVAVYGK